MGEFCFSFPVLGIDSLVEFLESCEGGQLVVVDYIIFDMFGESIVSLMVECCITPLNTCR